VSSPIFPQVDGVAAKLDERDRKILRLLFEGKTDSQIAKEVGLSYGGLRHRFASIQKRLGYQSHGRHELVLFYIRSLLATDLEGVPLTEGKTKYTKPGEKLAEWTAWAEDRRAIFLEEFNKKRIIKAIALLSNPENVDKSDEQLGALVEPPVLGSTYGQHVMVASRVFGTRVGIVVALALAPIVA